MQFQLPQFIETEAKIVGPLSLKQFGFLGAAGALLFGAYFIFTLPLFIIIAAILVPVAAALAFIKVNGRPFWHLASEAIGFYLKPRLYLWNGGGEQMQVKTLKPADSSGALKNLFYSLLTTTKPIENREKNKKPLTLFKQGNQGDEPKPKWQILRHTAGDREVARRVDYR